MNTKIFVFLLVSLLCGCGSGGAAKGLAIGATAAPIAMDAVNAMSNNTAAADTKKEQQEEEIAQKEFDNSPQGRAAAARKKAIKEEQDRQVVNTLLNAYTGK